MNCRFESIGIFCSVYQFQKISLVKNQSKSTDSAQRTNLQAFISDGKLLGHNTHLIFISSAVTTSKINH